MIDAKARIGGGRELAYTVVGAPGALDVLFFHGAPMSRLHLTYLHDRFAAGRIRVVSPDRPSYGGSSPAPGRSMADWPSDVAALADALGLDRFAVAGHSSGGPYAVACAALLPDRVSAGVVLGGVTNMGWPGAWEGYVESERELMRLPGEAAVIASCERRYGRDGSRFAAASDFEFAEPDTTLFADEQAGPALESAVAEAFRQGVAGYAQDVFVQGQPWPFDPGSISVPFEIVHGELDVLMPLAHSRHTSEVIRDAVLRVLPGHGHMTTVSELPALAAAVARGLHSPRQAL
jgi:pimeloyl-ACP methyl ester carboxylesterase